MSGSSCRFSSSVLHVLHTDLRNTKHDGQGRFGSPTKRLSSYLEFQGADELTDAQCLVCPRETVRVGIVVFTHEYARRLCPAVEWVVPDELPAWV